MTGRREGKEFAHLINPNEFCPHAHRSFGIEPRWTTLFYRGDEKAGHSDHREDRGLTIWRKKKVEKLKVEKRERERENPQSRNSVAAIRGEREKALFIHSLLSVLIYHNPPQSSLIPQILNPPSISSHKGQYWKIPQPKNIQSNVRPPRSLPLSLSLALPL